jgi:LPXTG-motif cell wall-anchored protein
MNGIRMPFLLHRTLAACAAAVVVVGLAAVAAPAYAADGPVLTVGVVSDDITLPLPADPGNPAQISWGLEKTGSGTADDVHIVFDLSGIADFASTTLACPHQGAVYTCDRGDIDNPGNSGGIVPLLPDADATAGDTGKVTISGTSANGQVVGTTVKVTAGSPDLRITPSSARGGVKPGSTLPEQLTIGNQGSAAADGVTLDLTITRGLGFGSTFSNCTYSTLPPLTYGFRTQRALCHIDTAVEPGKLYRLSTPVDLGVGKDALNELFDYGVTRGNGTTTGDGDGPVLSLVPADSGATGAGPSGESLITADNTADLSVTGDSVQGAPGDTVEVTATLDDKGPAWVGFENSDSQIALMVNIPKGTKAVAVPDECQPFVIDGPAEPALGKPQYICEVYPRTLTAGSSYAFTFGLKIDQDAYDTTGETHATTVYGNDKELTFDPDKTNNTATISVDVTGRGSAEPTPSASASASASASGSPSASASANAPQAQSGGAGNEPLAATGSSGMPLLAGAGVLAVGIGGVLFVLVRRRRKA